MRDNIETNYLIFISSDGKKSGFDIFNDRVQDNKWPIYNKTPQLRNVKEGKNVVFYIAGAGEKRQSFIGSAKIKSVSDNKNTTIDTNQETSIQQQVEETTETNPDVQQLNLLDNSYDILGVIIQKNHKRKITHYK